jgi:hypothetical protein
VAVSTSLTCAERRARKITGPELFVWLTYSLMFVAMFVFVVRYGRNVPYNEDWFLAGPYTGNEPNMPAWLWEQNNEHRTPVPRLLFLAALELSGGDFRAGMILSVVLLGVIGAAMLLVVRTIRGGRTTYSDIFFPVIFLNIGHAQNVLFSWQLQFVVSVVLSCVVLLVVTRREVRLTWRAVLSAGLSLVLLPLCGANGLFIAILMSPWFFLKGRLHCGRKTRVYRQRGMFLIGSVTAALMLCGLYFIDYYRPPWHPRNPGLIGTTRTYSKILALGFGPAASRTWTLSSIAALAAILSTAVSLGAAVLRTKGPEQQRAFGLLSFFGAAGAVIAGMAWGRAGMVAETGIPDRYVLLIVPMFCVCYVAWILYGPTRLRAPVQFALCLCMLISLHANTVAGLWWGDYYRSRMDAFENDLRAGTPVAVLVQRHGPFLMQWGDPEALTRYMLMLKHAEAGPFRHFPTGSSGP